MVQVVVKTTDLLKLKQGIGDRTYWMLSNGHCFKDVEEFEVRELKEKVEKLEFTFYFRFVEWERGGGIDEMSGEAVVICGVEGEKLTPRYIRKNPRARGEQALFVGRVLVIVNGIRYKRDRIKFNIQKAEVSEEGEAKRQEVINLEISGGIKDFSRFGKFKKAVEALTEKLYCQECQDIHYANI